MTKVPSPVFLRFDSIRLIERKRLRTRNHSLEIPTNGISSLYFFFFILRSTRDWRVENDVCVCQMTCQWCDLDFKLISDLCAHLSSNVHRWNQCRFLLWARKRRKHRRFPLAWHGLIGNAQRLRIEWDRQKRRSSTCHCFYNWSSQMFIFVDQDRDQSPIVDEEETFPFGDVVSPREIQWETRRFPTNSQPNLYFHCVRLRRRKKERRILDNNRHIVSLIRRLRKEMFRHAETLRWPTGDIGIWRRLSPCPASLSPISFDHHFKRDEEINKFLRTAWYLRTNEGFFVISQFLNRSVKLKERRATTCHEWVTFMLCHFFVEDNENITDGETNQALPSSLSPSRYTMSTPRNDLNQSCCVCDERLIPELLLLSEGEREVNMLIDTWQRFSIKCFGESRSKSETRKTTKSFFHCLEKNSPHFCVFDDHCRNETLVVLLLQQNWWSVLKRCTEKTNQLESDQRCRLSQFWSFFPFNTHLHQLWVLFNSANRSKEKMIIIIISLRLVCAWDSL